MRHWLWPVRAGAPVDQIRSHLYRLWHHATPYFERFRIIRISWTRSGGRRPLLGLRCATPAAGEQFHAKLHLYRLKVSRYERLTEGELFCRLGEVRATGCLTEGLQMVEIHSFTYHASGSRSSTDAFFA